MVAEGGVTWCRLVAGTAMGGLVFMFLTFGSGIHGIL